MSFPLAARGLVDETETADDLAAAIEEKHKATETGPSSSSSSSSMPVTTWRSSSDAERAAKVLVDVACACTRVTSKRKVPAQVLAQLEAAAGIAIADQQQQQQRSSSAGGV